MSAIMTALHPSNPYYTVTQHRNARPSNPPDLFSSPVEELQQPFTPPDPPRSASIATSTPSAQPQRPAAPSPHRRQTSVDYQNPRSATTFRTRSIGGPFNSGVYFEREIDLSPPNDEEIIIATVRVTDSFRRASIEENAELPARPPKRNFLRRVSTRVSSPTDHGRYTALKMPRKDYKKYFARDRDGNYAGTEPEQEWTFEVLQERFGQFQEMPLRSIPGGQEFGEGGPTEGGVGSGGAGPRRASATLPPLRYGMGWTTFGV